MKGLKKFLIWLPTVSYMAVIFYMSSLSKPITYELPHGTDKLLHFIEYAVLGFLMSYSLKKSGVKRYILTGWLFAALYALTDEIHQAFVPMRNASIFDFGADSIGGIIGSFIFKKIS
ncbi:MAG: VanZ family protein [Nitrospinota bacterium]